MNSTCITLFLSLLFLLLSGCDLGIIDKKERRSQLIDEAISSEQSDLSDHFSPANTSSETTSNHPSSDQKNHTTTVTSSYSLHTSSYTTTGDNQQDISSSNSYQAPTSEPYINPTSDTITEICTDGIDNDMDTKIDCEDPDCRRSEHCTEITLEQCTDGEDNDLDGKTDCNDSGCRRFEHCRETTLEQCTDGEDSDFDGRIDCNDPDCWSIEGTTCGEFSEALTEALCRDGLDNDEDGKIDCDDTDCRRFYELCPYDVVAGCNDIILLNRFEKFTMTVYDHDANTDFGVGGGKDSLRQGMVTDRLVDGRPAFKQNLFNNTHIAEWWSESYAISSTDVKLPFAKFGNTTYSYIDNDFFPLDGYEAREGDDGLNYYFAGHLQWEFVYDGQQGRYFGFSGNDDVFVYINGNLVLDIGGVHTPIEDNFTLDVELDRLGIGVGETVTLDFFMANRQQSGSQQVIEITVPCFITD